MREEMRTRGDLEGSPRATPVGRTTGDRGEDVGLLLKLVEAASGAARAADARPPRGRSAKAAPGPRPLRGDEAVPSGAEPRPGSPGGRVPLSPAARSDPEVRGWRPEQPQDPNGAPGVLRTKACYWGEPWRPIRNGNGQKPGGPLGGRSGDADAIVPGRGDGTVVGRWQGWPPPSPVS